MRLAGDKVEGHIRIPDAWPGWMSLASHTLIPHIEFSRGNPQITHPARRPGRAAKRSMVPCCV